VYDFRTVLVRKSNPCKVSWIGVGNGWLAYDGSLVKIVGGGDGEDEESFEAFFGGGGR
jgi:hypothetical protein